MTLSRAKSRDRQIEVMEVTGMVSKADMQCHLGELGSECRLVKSDPPAAREPQLLSLSCKDPLRLRRNVMIAALGIVALLAIGGATFLLTKDGFGVSSRGQELGRGTSIPATTKRLRAGEVENKASLFCFAAVLPGSTDLSLLISQREHHTGIFECNAFAVYSSEVVQLGSEGDVQTEVVKGDFAAPKEGEQDFGDALTPQSYASVWRRVFEEKSTYTKHDWIVKADPAAVFLPARLRAHLDGSATREASLLPQGAYLNNCKFGNLGALEVVSRKGVQAFSKGIGKCVEKDLAPFKDYPGNVFLRRCLDHVGVQKLDDFQLLSSTLCEQDPSPCLSDAVAFHPFQEEFSWLQCFSETATVDKAAAEAAAKTAPTSTITTSKTMTRTTSETTTTTGAPTTTPTTEPPPPSLYCFVVVRPDSYEIPLVSSQLEHRVGIFACEEFGVFSNQVLRIGYYGAAPVETDLVEGSLVAPIGGLYNMALNTEIFVRVWKKVFSEGTALSHDWTVKVDPDAVFLTERLREHIARPEAVAAALQPNGTFLNNCKIGLHGPLEVVSKAGMQTFSSGMQACIDEDLAPMGEIGEDVFLRRCLQHLGTQRMDDFELLSEVNCFENPSPCTSGKVSFHPFKDESTYFQCMTEAGVEVPPALPAPPPEPAQPPPAEPPLDPAEPPPAADDADGPGHLCKPVGCEIGFIRGRPCQCNSNCEAFGSCCSDYESFCQSGAAAPA